jgi:error-prone DNA polymerase
MTAYAELQVTTHFSFLRGASSVEELFAEAALLGIGALGIADRHSLAGIVRAHEAAKVTGVRAIIGCRLDLTDGAALLVYPTDRAAYGRLCRLLTLGKARAGKGGCALAWDDVIDHGEGLIAILVPDRPDPLCAAQRAPHLAGGRDLYPRRRYDRRCRLPARAPRPERGRPAPAQHDDLQAYRRRLAVPRQADRRHGREWLCPSLCREDLRAA